MKILFTAQAFGSKETLWCELLKEQLPRAEIQIYPEISHLEEVDYAIVWKAPQGLLKRCTKLKGILSLGAGVDHLITDPELPKDVPIVRLVDEELTQQMCQYAMHWVLHFHHHYHHYIRQQKQQHWQAHMYIPTAQKTVGILGLGHIGSNVAKALKGLCFNVIGWGSSLRDADKIPADIDYYRGLEQLPSFLNQSHYLINLLPKTTPTINLINHQRIEQLPQGAFIINMGRGEIIDEKAVLNALNNNHLAAVAFDVFAQEPLPKEHLLWQHNKAYITPHIAGQTYPVSACKIIAENIMQLEKGEKPYPLYQPKRGY